jgi:hypothetical protein
MTETIFDEPEEHVIAKDYLSALINGDYSSFAYHYESEHEEARAIKRFDNWVRNEQADRLGHWSYPDEEEHDNYARCEICGLMADCVTVTFHPKKSQAFV